MLEQETIDLYSFTPAQVDIVNILLAKSFLEWKTEEMKYWKSLPTYNPITF